MRCILLLTLILTSCGYDINSDPHRLAKGKSEMGTYAPQSSSIFCESSIVVSKIGDYEHEHEPRVLALSEVVKAQGGTYRLLGGSHEHSYQLSQEHMGSLLRKREIIVVDLQGHTHNVSVRCLR